MAFFGRSRLTGNVSGDRHAWPARQAQQLIGFQLKVLFEWRTLLWSSNRDALGYFLVCFGR
jgi:hypothetical protein